jgi:malonyl-CoA O-methyltransferase
VSFLSARDGYRLWASTYDAETAVSLLDERVVAELDVSTSGRRLLDVGCGTGRRLRLAEARVAVGVDLSVEMLRRGRAANARAAGDVCALPIADGAFDVAWCRLVLGHVRDLDAAYAEIGRVCRPGGDVVVTDFHPAAVAAGHRRTFRDAGGVSHQLEHHVHTPDDHVAAARAAGLVLRARRDGTINADVESLYAAAGRRQAYHDHLGLPLVLGLALRKAACGS